MHTLGHFQHLLLHVQAHQLHGENRAFEHKYQQEDEHRPKHLRNSVHQMLLPNILELKHAILSAKNAADASRCLSIKLRTTVRNALKSDMETYTNNLGCHRFANFTSTQHTSWCAKSTRSI